MASDFSDVIRDRARSFNEGVEAKLRTLKSHGVLIAVNEDAILRLIREYSHALRQVVFQDFGDDIKVQQSLATSLMQDYEEMILKELRGIRYSVYTHYSQKFIEQWVDGLLFSERHPTFMRRFWVTYIKFFELVPLEKRLQSYIRDCNTKFTKESLNSENDSFLETLNCLIKKKLDEIEIKYSLRKEEETTPKLLVGDNTIFNDEMEKYGK